MLQEERHWVWECQVQTPGQGWGATGARCQGYRAGDHLMPASLGDVTAPRALGSHTAQLQSTNGGLPMGAECIERELTWRTGYAW
jgi:hypothetical protein